MAKPRVRPTPHERDAARLAEARPGTASKGTGDETEGKVAECAHKLAEYRTALDAGAKPATVAAWIAETEAERASYALVMRRPTPRRRMTEQEINTIVGEFADIARVRQTQTTAEDRVPSIRAIRRSFHVGQPRAQRLREYLAMGVGG